MTSATSHDDIEDSLIRNGMKNPVARAQVMRTIDAHISFRLYGTPELTGAHSGLLPGESDFEEKVTRCLKCSEVKGWSSFTRSRKSDSRHADICISCELGEIPDDLFLECKGPCGKTLHASNFYRRKDTGNFIGKCKTCASTAADREEYKCSRCHQDKRLSAFPEAKRRRPKLTIPCTDCLAQRPEQRSSSTRWTCTVCKKRRPYNAFGAAKKENPARPAVCISCEKN